MCQNINWKLKLLIVLQPTPSSQSNSPSEFGSSQQNWSFEEQFKQVRPGTDKGGKCIFIWSIVNFILAGIDNQGAGESVNLFSNAAVQADGCLGYTWPSALLSNILSLLSQTLSFGRAINKKLSRSRTVLHRRLLTQECSPQLI